MADVVVGGNDKLSKSQFFSRKTYLIIFPTLIIALIISFVLLVIPKKSQTAFVIDGKSYSKKQIEGMLEYSSKYGKTNIDSAKEIFNMYRTQQASMATGVEPSSEDIKNTKAELNLPQKNDKFSQAYIDLYVYNKALENSYLNYSYDKTSGYSFVFDFSEGMKEDNSVGPDYKNNKAYAKQKAYYYYDQLKSKKITPDELLSKIQKDNRIGRLPLSIHFGPNQDGDLMSQLFNPDIYNYVINQKKPGLSKVMVAQVQNSTSKTNPKYREAYYYFVQLDTAGAHIKDPQQTIKATINTQKVTYYGVRNAN